MIPGQARGSGGLRFAGYAALFDVADAAGDVIRRGAFARAIAETQEVPLFWQHRPGQRIGRIEALAEDARGLRVVARIDPGVRPREADGLSFGYRARAYRKLPQGRLLEDIELFEVSLVTHPLQFGARVHLIQSVSRGDAEARRKGGSDPPRLRVSA